MVEVLEHRRMLADLSAEVAEVGVVGGVGDAVEDLVVAGGEAVRGRRAGGEREDRGDAEQGSERQARGAQRISNAAQPPH